MPCKRHVGEPAIELVGWMLPSRVAKGAEFKIVLVYRALQPIERSWQVFVHLAGPSWINADHAPLAGRCATSNWHAGDVLVNEVTTKAMASGVYLADTGFFVGSDRGFTNLPVSDAPPSVVFHTWGDRIKLGTIAVE